MPVTARKEIKPGTTVDVVQKQDQTTGKLTRGIVKDILTNSTNHPRGIKVRLQDGRVGRVQAIISQPAARSSAAPRPSQPVRPPKPGKPTSI
nr:YwbE family protein [Candidatus Sigynarchaeum springense]